LELGEQVSLPNPPHTVMAGQTKMRLAGKKGGVFSKHPNSEPRSGLTISIGARQEPLIVGKKSVGSRAGDRRQPAPSRGRFRLGGNPKNGRRREEGRSAPSGHPATHQEVGTSALRNKKPSESSENLPVREPARERVITCTNTK